ncbi:hypothetical protein BGX33_010698 [Mortierella sp. NVP41]|nr:hypothetical protein BGX33_010698 [Mortierella sp. NVP41]
MAPLSQTRQTVEPKFKIECKEDWNAARTAIFSVVSVLIFFIAIFPFILKRISIYHYKQAGAIFFNGLTRIYNVFHKSNPVNLVAVPTRERSAAIPRRMIIPLTTANTLDSNPDPESTPKRGFISWLGSLFS